MNIQIKKGALELCVLALLSRRDCYGFELVSALAETTDISEGTIYPLLKRLRDDDLLTTYLRESTEGPPRKYYHLTDRGRKAYEALREEWLLFTRGVERILADSSNMDSMKGSDDQ